MKSEHKKIFVVEDDSLISGYLETVLKHFHYEVEVFHNGINVLSKIREVHPDLVLLDITLPDIDGITICAQVRADPEISKTPIVILTCLTDEATVRKAKESGANDFLAKPFTQALLISKIKSALLP